MGDSVTASIRLLVCGSREWTDVACVSNHIAALARRGSVIIHGGNGRREWAGTLRERFVGADIIAGHCARMLGASEDVYGVTAEEWKSIGKKAGPLRNSRMLKGGKPDRGLAFGALYLEDIDPWMCARCGALCSKATDHHRWCPTPKSPPLRRTGTGDMVSLMLRAGIPVRWIAAPDAPAVDLTEMPGPPT